MAGCSYNQFIIREDPLSGRKLKIGDIAEIKTPVGWAYIQYTHDGKDMGQLVRVLPHLYSARPTNFAEFARQRELYFIFYTLEYAVRAGQTEIVSNQPVPDWARPVPPMRHRSGESWRIMSALDPITVRFLQSTPGIQKLTPEQRKLSIHVLRSHPAMVAELARGWVPERAEELEEHDRAMARARRSSQKTNALTRGQTIRHFLYFPNRVNAERAAQWFQSQGFLVEFRLGADGENWLTSVKHPTPATTEEMDKLRDEMEALAADLGGEYDGWEAIV